MAGRAQVDREGEGENRLGKVIGRFRAPGLQSALDLVVYCNTSTAINLRNMLACLNATEVRPAIS